MFNSAKRTLYFLARTPVLPPPAAPPAFELTTLSAGPSRPRAASRTFSSLSAMSARSGRGAPVSMGGMQMDQRRMASDRGKQELYSDEGGSTGAGTDDVAHTDAAFNKDPNPKSSAKQAERETGKDMSRSAANADYSHPPGEQGGKKGSTPMNTSKKDAKQ